MCVKSQGGVYRRDPIRTQEPLEGAQVKLEHTLAPTHSPSKSHKNSHKMHCFETMYLNSFMQET